MSLTFSHVSKSFQHIQVLQDFSFTFEPGGRYCLMGPSGAGKTTLLRLAAGLLPVDSGQIHKDGTLSFMFQEDRLLPWYSAIKNVALVSDEKTAATLLEELGLSSFAQSMPNALSGGMRRRVAIARTLAKKSDIYLFDEPLKELDEANKKSVAEVINAYTKDALCLFVSHTKEDADLFHAQTLTFSAAPLMFLQK